MWTTSKRYVGRIEQFIVHTNQNAVQQYWGPNGIGYCGYLVGAAFDIVLLVDSKL